MKTTALIGAGLWLAWSAGCQAPSTKPESLPPQSQSLEQQAARPELRYYVIGDA